MRVAAVHCIRTSGSTAETAQTVDLQNLDVVDIFHWANRFADDVRQVFQQRQAYLHFYLLHAQHVGRFVDRAGTFGIHFVLLLLRLRQQDFGIGFTLGLQALLLGLGFGGNTYRFSAVLRSQFFGIGGYG